MARDPLSPELGIRVLMHRYAAAIDACDTEALLACFAEDATLETLVRGDEQPVIGREAVVDSLLSARAIASEVRRDHLVSELEIGSVRDGVVLVSSRLDVIATGPAGARHWLAGTYRDECVVGQTQWVFASRRFDLVFRDGGPAEEGTS